MITLATGGTLKGKAGTATAVTYTLSSGDIPTTTDSFQILGQGQLPSSTGDLLTTTPVPSSTSYLIDNILFTNTTSSPVTGIVLYVNGSAAGNQIVQFSMTANGSTTYANGTWTNYDSSGNILFGSGFVVSVTAADSSITIGGTSTNPTVSRAALTGDVTASAGSNATTLAAGNAGNLNSGTLLAARLPALTGDATSSVGTAATTVVKIQGVAVDPTAPTNGQVLQLVAGSPNKWIPESYGGDVSGGPSASVVAAIQSHPVSSTTPTTSQILQYNSGSTWAMANLNFNVVSYGGDPTGSSNSATAIQNAVNAAQAAAYSSGSGAVVWFPPGRYLIGSTITITGHNITLQGAGGGQSADFGNYATPMASHLVPQSAIKAVVVIPVQTNGLSGNPNFGFKWKGLGIDNYANAGTIGLQLISCQNFEIDDFYAINSTSVGLDMNTLPATTNTATITWPLSAATITVASTAASGTGPAFPANTNTAGTLIVKDGGGTQRAVTYTGGSATTFTGCSSAGAGTGTTGTGNNVTVLPGAQDTTRGRVGIINFRQIDSGGASGTAIQLNGDGAGLANTNLINWVGPIKIAHNNGIGINDINSDTNTYESLIINRASGGTGIGAVIGAGSTNAFASRNNVFGHCSFGPGGITTRGTPTATFPSGPTIVMNYQLANGEALPTVEAGSLLDVRNFNGAFRVGNLTAPTVTTQALTAATLNIVTGTKFVVPPQGFQVGAHLKWEIPLIKTAVAGISWLYNIRYGTGAVGTGAILQTVTYTATAAADGGILEIHCIITALGSGTSATNTGYALLKHDVTVTGLSTGVTSPVADATAVTGHVYTRPTFAGFDSTLPASGTPQFLFVEINPVTAGTVQTIEPGAQAFCLAQSNF